MTDVQTIAQTYLKPSATLSDNVAWAEICALTRLNLMLSFTPSDSLDSALFLPEIIHVLTLLVGSGPLLMRQTVYGLFVNTLQSLASSSPSDGVDGTALQQALDKAQMDDMMSCFDLVTSGRGLDVAPGSTQRDDTDMHLLDHVDTLARFLGDVLVAAAPNFGEPLSRHMRRFELTDRLRKRLASKVDGPSGWYLFPA